MKNRITVSDYSSPKRRRWIYASLILLFVLIPVIVFVVLRFRLEQKAAYSYTRSMQTMLERQSLSVDSALDTITLELYQFSSDINFINVGLTEKKDDDTLAAFACNSLNHAAALNPFVFSMYLVCKRNATIYNSTDYMAYASDQFFDLDWISQYSPKAGGIQLLDTVRIISTPSRQNKRLISFLSKVPNLSSLDYKYLIINVDLDELGNSLILDSRTSSLALDPAGMSLLIYNAKGEQLYTQRNAFSNLTTDDLLREETGADHVPASGKVSVGVNSYLAVSCYNDREHWTFVQLLPWDYIAGYRNSLLLYSFGPFMAFYLILFSVLLAVSLVTRSRQRTKALLLGEATGDRILPEEPIQDYLFRIAMEEHGRSEDMTHLLTQSQPVLTEYAVKSLLYNETAAAAVTGLRKALMHQYGILEEPSRIYTVMLAQVEAISLLKMNIHRDTYNQLRHTIEFGCREQLPEYCEAYFVWHNYSRLCCLLSFPAQMEGETLGAQMNEIAHNVQNLIALLSREPAIVGFGDPTASLEDVNISYEQARQLIHHKSYRKTDLPYTYADLAESELDMTYDQQKNLIDQIRLGKTEKALRILESYFSVLSSHPETKPEYVKKICIRLAGEISSAIGGWQPETDRTNPPEGETSGPALPEDIGTQISRAETLTEIADLMTSYVSACTAHMSSVSENRQSERFQEVLTWINNNYSQDISLSDAAAVVSLSSSYVSRMLKQATGDSFVVYLNKIRIEHAKELLVTTSLSSNDISAAIGYRYPQNFIRNFQKYAGMTPGNYRALHQGKES